MNTVAPLLSLLLAISWCALASGRAAAGGGAPRRLITKTLTLNNGMDWGTWGTSEYCPDGSFAKNLEAKFEKYSTVDIDETALNALKLYCVDLYSGEEKGEITSKVGQKGSWQGTRMCHVGLLTAMKARVLGSQGTIGDDVAVQNVQMECDHGKEILTAVDGALAKIPLGDWGDWSACPDDSAICGIETRYNAPSLLIDDAGITDITMFCCSLTSNATSPSY